MAEARYYFAINSGVVELQYDEEVNGRSAHFVESKLTGIVNSGLTVSTDGTWIFKGDDEANADALIELKDNTIVINNSENVFAENATSISMKDDKGTGAYEGDYKLALGGDLKEEVTDENHETTQELGNFTVSGTTATATATVDGVYVFNEKATTLYKSVDYTVTVDGLASGVKTSDLTSSGDEITVGADGLADGITVTTALKDTEAKNVPTTVDYKLEVAEGEGKASVNYAWYQKPKAADVTLYQTVTGGKDTYYSEGTVIKQIEDESATEGKETELCTVTGLGLEKNTETEENESGRKVAVRKDVTDAVAIDVDEGIKMKGGTTGVLVVNSDLLNLDDPLKKLQIKGQGSFKFEFAQKDADLEVHEITEDKAEWVVSKGKAVLTGGMSKGYTLSSDGKTLTYTKEKPNAIATISGFKKNLTEAQCTTLAEALSGVTQDGVVTLTKEILDDYADNSKAVKVALKNGKDKTTKKAYEYKLELADNSGFEAEGTWKLGVKNDKLTGKAIYTGKVTAGYVISGGTITKADDKDEGTELVELSGLNVTKLNEIIEELGENFTLGETDDDILREALALEDGKFVLNKYEDVNIFDSKKVSIKNKVKGVEFRLNVEDGDLGQVDDVTTWTVDSKAGTAKYYIGKSAGYVVDEKKGTTATFTQPGTDDIKATLATLSGLPKTATTDDFKFGTETDDETGVTTTTNEIVLQKSLFNGLKKETTITLTNGKDAEGADCTYTLGVADGLNTDGTAQPYWNVEKGKVTVANGTPEYWDISTAGKVTYKLAGKPTATYATVSGLNKEATEDDVNVDLDSGVITVNKAAIDTSEAKLKKTKVTLKLGKNVVAGTYKIATGSGFDTSDFAEASWAWDTTTKSGQATYKYKATSDGLVCDGTSITYNGDGGTYKPTALATLKNITGTIADPDENSGVVKLTSANLTDGKKPAIGKKDPYVIVLHAGDSKSQATGKWAVSGSTATLTGTKTLGHKQKDDKNIDAVAATKANKTEELAKITGATDKLKDVEVKDKSTIDLTQEQLSTTVTVDGKGIFGFNFGKTDNTAYSNAMVTGTTANDSFTFDGGVGLTIDTKAGNDYVKLGTADRSNAADTFVYASGDGYDEVADFMSKDELNITGAKKIEVTHDETNTYVNVDGAGVITLDSFEYSAVNISGASSASLIADENYDFNSSEEGFQNIITVGDNGQALANYENSFTLKGDSDFTATISFTKKGAAAPAGGGD